MPARFLLVIRAGIDPAPTKQIRKMTLRYAPTDLIATHPNWAFADFERHALQLSAQLHAEQIRSLALWFEDGAKLACTLLACWHAGVKTLFPPNDTPESRKWVEANADIWLTDTMLSHPQAVQFADFSAKAMLQKNVENRPLVSRQNQTALLMKTSGSSGEAKTIEKTAEELWLSAEVLANALPFAQGNQITSITSVSAQHIYGLTVQIMMSLVQGWIIGRKQQFFPENLQAESAATCQSVLISSPAMLSRMAWQQLDFPQLVGVISSGGALDTQLSEQIRHSLSKPVVEIYGSTETGPIAVRADIGLWQTLPYSEVGTDEQGALWLEAKWAKDRQQTADAVEIYPNGFELLGRIDRIVKIGDKRTSLVGVETALNQHPWLNDCYIAQHPCQPRLAAWVELNDEGITAFREQGRKAVIEALRRFLTASQESSAVPRFWRFTDHLPRNSQSKISRVEFEKTCLHFATDPIWLSESVEADWQIFHGKVPLDLAYFGGHFANFPLVPGVVEMQWVMDKIHSDFGEEKAVARFDNLKFQKFLRPNDELELRLKWEESKNRMAFQLKTGGEMCGSGLVVFL